MLLLYWLQSIRVAPIAAQKKPPTQFCTRQIIGIFNTNKKQQHWDKDKILLFFPDFLIIAFLISKKSFLQKSELIMLAHILFALIMITNKSLSCWHRINRVCEQTFPLNSNIDRCFYTQCYMRTIGSSVLFPTLFINYANSNHARHRTRLRPKSINANIDWKTWLDASQLQHFFQKMELSKSSFGKSCYCCPKSDAAKSTFTAISNYMFVMTFYFYSILKFVL